MKYVMFEHAGAGNHGCEAIVRSTINILGTSEEYYLQTFNSSEDTEYRLNEIANLITQDNQTLDRNSVKGLMMRVQSRITPGLNYDDIECLYRNKRILIKPSIALSIGGDNYCYAGIVHSMRDKLNAFSMKKIPTVLWGCSVDRTYLDKATIADLKKYSLITARESLTVNVLNEVGILDTVVQCSDPAFTLQRQSVSWHDDILKSKNVIGINVSDFMKYYNAYPDATYRNFISLIRHLLETTDCFVAMLPHVRQKGNDDLEPIKKLASEIQSPRILIVDEKLNCMQLKDIIARCRLFIGCRTHSTIAAYSTGVPTLVVGYSIKARGICKDLFGDTNGLLVDVREFNTDNDLVYAFDMFMEREQEIRVALKEIMPQYCQKAYNAKRAIERRILNEG